MADGAGDDRWRGEGERVSAGCTSGSGSHNPQLAPQGQEYASDRLSSSRHRGAPRFVLLAHGRPCGVRLACICITCTCACRTDEERRRTTLSAGRSCCGCSRSAGSSSDKDRRLRAASRLRLAMLPRWTGAQAAPEPHRLRPGTRTPCLADSVCHLLCRLLSATQHQCRCSAGFAPSRAAARRSY
jgi:hypothetical protein